MLRLILTCRRTLIALFAIGCLTALGLYKGQDVAMPLATVAIGLAASNAAEKAAASRSSFRKEEK